MNKYPLIRSALEGIFGAQVGMDDDSAMEALRSDLNHLPFLEGIRRELAEALADEELSWRQLLVECDVDAFQTEVEAELFVRHNLLGVVDTVFGERRSSAQEGISNEF
jgi:hypothetical protein